MIKDISEAKRLYEQNGQTILTWFNVNKLGKYRIKVSILSVNSIRKQAIGLFFGEFKGSVLRNGNSLKIPKTVFGHYKFTQDEILQDGLLFEITAESGYLSFANASNEPDAQECFTSAARGREFWIEILSENIYRFHCNDNFDTKTYDNFIFDLEISDVE